MFEGSAAELEYLMILVKDLGFIAADRSNALCAEIQEVARMLFGLRKKVETNR